MIENYARALIKWRWLVIAASLVLVGLVGSGGRFLEFTNDYRVFFSKDNPQLAAFENLQDTYSKNDNVLVMLLPKSGNVFIPEVLEAVVELTERSWQIPYSLRVDSISNFQHTYAENDDLVVADLIEKPADLSAQQLTDIKAIVIAEPMLNGRLISPSGHATAVNVTVELPGLNLTTEGPEVVKASRELIAEIEAKYPDIEFYTTGVVMMNNAFPEASIKDMMTLIPLMFIVILVVMGVFLRTISGTVTTFVLIFFSIITAYGAAGWLGIQLTPPSMSAQTMIMTLAVADSIHFLATMLYLMRHGSGRNDAIVESLRVNIMPIFLTSVTTAIGFLSMNFSDSPPFRDLGNITAMGVMAALFFSITFLPAMMALLPVKVKQATSGGLTGLMEKLAEVVIRRRWAFLAVMGIITVVLATMIPRNELNDVFVEYFDESITFRTDTDKVNDNLTGLYNIDYSLDSKDEGGISSPEFLAQVQAFGNWYEDQPETRHVNIISDTFKRLNKNLHGDEQQYYNLPEKRDLAAQYLLLYEMSLPYGLDLNNQISTDKAATRVSVSLKTLSTTDVLAMEKRAQAWMQANTPDLTIAGASPTVMFSHIGMRNIKSMLKGTLLALVLISVILIFALRSLRLGLVSLIPNLAPAAVAFGVWGLLVGQIGLALSVVVAMTLGIVVDDTVHFLSKYLRAKREQGLDTEGAVRYAFRSVGVALTVNTIVLVAGFSVLTQSAFTLNSDMGLMTALTITMALILDFLLLPPLLMWLDNKQEKRTQENLVTAE